MTDKQQASGRRNWDILRLRGLWANAETNSLLRATSVVQIQSLVDEALEDAGTESETTRRQRKATKS